MDSYSASGLSGFHKIYPDPRSHPYSYAFTLTDRNVCVPGVVTVATTFITNADTAGPFAAYSAASPTTTSGLAGGYARVLPSSGLGALPPSAMGNAAGNSQPLRPLGV